MKIDHIGYAVKKIEEARFAFEKLGFRFEELIQDEDRNLYLQFGYNDDYRIELISTLNIENGSPVSSILKKTGPLPYHLCYISDNLEQDIAILEKQQFKVTVPPAPAIAFGGKRVVFMMHRHIGLIEVVENH